MTLFGDGLDAAVQKAFTRPAPKRAGPQMRYLVQQFKGTRRSPTCSVCPSGRSSST
ncbi:hypothetical protein [Streptomyces chartreusis]